MAKKTKKKIKRRREFDREALFPNKSAPEILKIKDSVEKCITKAEEDTTVRESRLQYVDDMIEELDKLIEEEQKLIAIVDDAGHDLSKVYNFLVQRQGNGHGFNS